MRVIKWALIGCGDIAQRRVAPALRDLKSCELIAVSRSRSALAESFAHQFGAGRWYREWQELTTDREVDAVYIATPVHLHAEQTVAAAEAGKHVLCEKPIGLNVQDALPLLEVRNRCGVRIEEAFMVRTHPQWVRVLELIRADRIGQVRSVMGQFSYDNPDPHNIRNIAGIGGGGLMDIGCYLIYFSRLVFQGEPRRVVGLIHEDPLTRTDVLTSALLDFPDGQSAITCSTRMTPFQRVQITGTRGRIEVQIPVNAPPDRPCRILIDDGSDLFGAGAETIEFPVCDQYTIQGDLFASAIRENHEPIISLEESLKNMAVIDAVSASARSGQWEVPRNVLSAEL